MSSSSSNHPNVEESIWNMTSTPPPPPSTTTVAAATTTTTMVMMPRNEAQLQNDSPPLKMPLNRTRNRLASSPTGKKPTEHWVQSFYQTRTTTEPTQVNYTDRSKLDLCDGFYDAITMYKGILFIFKGQVRLPPPLPASSPSTCSFSISGNTIDAVWIPTRRW